MSTPEEREQFCEENPDHDRCGCQRLIEDYRDHYKEYEKKINLRDNWWAHELEKYNKAYSNVKDYAKAGTPIYGLNAWRVYKDHLSTNLRQNDTTCKNSDGNIYICDRAKNSINDCAYWFPNLCTNGGCEFYLVGEDTNYGCSGMGCDGFGDANSRVWGCRLTKKGEQNVLTEWENFVGKKYYPGYCKAEFKDESEGDVKGRNCETYNRVIGKVEEPEQPRAQCCANTIKVNNVSNGGMANFSDIIQHCEHEINENLKTEIQNPDLANVVEDTKENETTQENETTVEIVQESKKKSSGGGGVIVGIILLVLSIIAIYYFFIRSTKQSG